ncbi:Uma2 family endonuclease [Mitsuaria sp. GD03876]|uniref:Uma2 family endonuclease n=1 Tax=Mitsuaria sp. GD03876 TaxID=2975399 RepID=UPI00244900AA|nr:Uma2 family endonuclease [Mitsuaria sp. GD03876]MDH0865736.1 Uma2 family endonuclease [Mitsuaria sp. GD03876]
MSYMPVEQLMTADEFLAWQDRQEVPHELLGGLCHPVPARDLVFFRLLVNLTTAITNGLGDAPWATFMGADPLVANAFDVLRPDAFVARGVERSPPVLACLFTTTGGAVDGRRLDALRRVETLRELVIVDRQARAVTVERREAPGTWVRVRHEAGATVRLSTLEIAFPVSDVFVGLDEPDPSLTFEAFWAWDQAQVGKHEFLDGRIVAMTGARVNHGTTCMNLATTFHRHLAGTPCRVFSADAAVRIPLASSHFYPDVVVTCESLCAEQWWLEAPVLVIEVLSMSTQRYDRTDKARAYFCLPSLREYVLVDHVRRHIDLHRREADGSWSRHPSIGDAPLHLQSLDLTVPAEVIYAHMAPSGQAAA